MNIYQIKHDRYNDINDMDEITSFLVMHEKSFTQDELQKFVKLAKMDMEHYPDFKRLPKEMEKYGFKQVITAYYDNY